MVRALGRFCRSMRDAARHRPLRGPAEGSPLLPLPESLIPLDSPAGLELAEAGLVNRKLAAAIQRQEHPAFCGIAAATSLTGALRFGVADQWRFADGFGGASGSDVAPWPAVMAHFGWGIFGTLLDAAPVALKRRLLEHLQFDGLPLGLLAAWFRAQGYSVDEIYASDADLALFRTDVSRSGESSISEHQDKVFMLINYSRRAVGQEMFSGGHWAPIGGYHEPSDKVLVLDVNMRRYPSVWVELPVLWRAVHTQVANGTWRGYLRIKPPPHLKE